MLVSSGTLLMVIGISDGAVSSGALLYLVSSTLTINAFFLLIELVERGAGCGRQCSCRYHGSIWRRRRRRGSEEQGVTMPGTMAVLGICFCRLRHSSRPAAAFSGFIAKFAILSAMMNRSDWCSAYGLHLQSLIVLVILSGIAALISMTRASIRTFEFH